MRRPSLSSNHWIINGQMIDAITDQAFMIGSHYSLIAIVKSYGVQELIENNF